MRVRLACGPRVEWHAVNADVVDIGSGPDADLIIEHPSVAPRHARLCLRRGALVLVNLPSGKSVRTGERVVHAPVALEAGEPFELGQVKLQAWLTSGSSLVGTTLQGWRVSREIDGADEEVRRYRVRSGAVQGELSLLEPDVEPARMARWLERSRESTGHALPHLPELMTSGRWHERPYLIEDVGEGVRLATVLGAVDRGELRLPREATLLILSQLASGVGSLHGTWGPHGGVEPRLVHLGIDGAVLLLRPGPLARGYDDPRRRAYLAPERLYGGPASVAADAWAVGRIADRLLGKGDDEAPEPLEPLLKPLRSPDPGARGADLADLGARLRDAVHRQGLDPSLAHVARVVRLLSGMIDRPLARPGGDLCASVPAE